MRAITHCPACHTEFFVNEVQLAQHLGKVRCGECLHVFDATAQLVTPQSENNIVQDSTLSHDAQPNAAASLSTRAHADQGIYNFLNTKSYPQDQPYNAEDAEALKPAKQIIKMRRLPALLLAMGLGGLVVVQSVYYLRHDIALYYPAFKPALVNACQRIACTIDLPKKIDLIVIEDSDLHEDEIYAGLIRFTSTLINQASFNQAYPNLEVTLTDIEDKPKLRRIFKPSEYLPAGSNLSLGIPAKAPLNIALNISTTDDAVAGYRVAVSY